MACFKFKQTVYFRHVVFERPYQQEHQLINEHPNDVYFYANWNRLLFNLRFYCIISLNSAYSESSSIFEQVTALGAHASTKHHLMPKISQTHNQLALPAYRIHHIHNLGTNAFLQIHKKKNLYIF